MLLNSIYGAATAFQAEVTVEEADLHVDPRFPANSLIGGTQKISLRILKSWKGTFKPGTTFHMTFSVVTLCGGHGCIEPFTSGEPVLILSPYAEQFLASGPRCTGTFDGIDIKRVLMLPSLPTD